MNGVSPEKSCLGFSGANCSKRTTYVPSSLNGPYVTGDASPLKTCSPVAGSLRPSGGTFGAAVVSCVGDGLGVSSPPQPASARAASEAAIAMCGDVASAILMART